MWWLVACGMFVLCECLYVVCSMWYVDCAICGFVLSASVL